MLLIYYTQKNEELEKKFFKEYGNIFWKNKIGKCGMKSIKINIKI